MDYSVKIAFTSDNMSIAEEILDEMAAAFDEFVENLNVTCSGVVILPGHTITQKELDADAAFSEAMVQHMNAGVNTAEMPEGMPSL